jgi:hypothetical protein
MMRAVIASLVLWLAAAARGDVRWTVPFAARVGAAKLIAVAKVARVEGTGPFTVAHPPTVTLEVTRAIRGCRLQEKLRFNDFGAEQPPWAAVQSPPRKATEPIGPPAVGSEFLILLPHTEGPMRVGFEARATYGSPPDPNQVELAAAMAMFHFERPSDDVIRSVVGGPVILKLTLANDTAGPATFDVGGLRLSTRPPGAYDDLHGSPPHQKVVFKPHETKSFEWDLAALVPSLFTVPGDYYIRVEVPAAGDNDFFDLHVERVERSSAFLCGRAQIIARPRVESIAGRKITVSDPIALRGDPGAQKEPIELPAWSAAPQKGRRAIICLHDGKAEWVESETSQLSAQILGVVEGDNPPFPPDARFTPKEDLPASELHKIEARTRLAAP